METTKEIRELQKNRPLSGDTLEDVTRKDLDNFNFLLSDTRTYCFGTFAQVERNIALRFNHALKKVGIDMEQFLSYQNPEVAIDKKMKEAGVKVEHRQDKGIYFYVRGELVFFLSKPKVNQFAAKDYQRYSIQTNIRL